MAKQAPIVLAAVLEAELLSLKVCVSTVTGCLLMVNVALLVTGKLGHTKSPGKRV